MDKDGIRLVGDWPAWGLGVRHGVLEPDGRGVPVLLRPIAGAAPEDLALHRAEVRRLARVEDPGLLGLLDVVEVGTEQTLVYQMVDACSVGRLMEAGLPMRVVVELGAAVAGVLASVQGGAPGEPDQLVHPGATPLDVLVDARGDVRVLGFRQTAGVDVQGWASPPGYGPPEGVTGAVRSTYGLGALLVEMIAGAPPASAAGGLEAHETVIGTAVAAVRRRRGDAVPDELLVLLGRCLEGAPRDRPSLADAGSILRELARGLEGPDLRRWAARAIPQAFSQDGLTIPVVGGGPGDGSAVSVGTEGPPDAQRPGGLQPFDLPREDTAEARPTTVELGYVPAGSAVLEPMLEPEETEEAWPGRDAGLGALSPAGDRMPGGGPRPSEATSAESPDPVRMGADASPARGRSWALLLGGGVLVGGLVWGLRINPTTPSAMDRGIASETVRPVTSSADVAPAGTRAPAVSVTGAFPGTEGPLAPQPASAPEPASVSGATPAAEPASDSEPAPTIRVRPSKGEAAGTPPPSGSGVSAPAQPSLSAGGQAAARAVRVADAASAPSKPVASSSAPAARVDTGGSFEVTFLAADPSVTELEVRCHRGRGDGTEEVVLSDAGPGPCKVTGRRSGSSLVAVVTLTGPATYRCFERGARRCL